MLEMTSLSLNRPLGLQKIYGTQGWNVVYKLENVKCYFVINISSYLQTDSYQNNWTAVLWTDEDAFYPYIVSL